VHTVIETSAYLAQAKAEGMSEEEMKVAVDTVAADPQGGVVIARSGGFRKRRIAGKGKGKSGGYRIVSYYAGERVPTFMIAVLSKSSRENFSKAEVNAMKAAGVRLVESLGPKAIG
jgi:hypothetical protein